MAAQLICNQLVAGSTPVISSKKSSLQTEGCFFLCFGKSEAKTFDERKGKAFALPKTTVQAPFSAEIEGMQKEFSFFQKKFGKTLAFSGFTWYNDQAFRGTHK